MFLDFYKLREQPFGVTPDPRYLYFSPGHREALASLFYGIETGRGFLSLVAEPGMGKTTLLFQLLQRWRGYVHSAFLFQTQCTSRELIRYLMNDLGLRSDGEDIVKLHSELNDFLFQETKAGRRVVVFIDEAQNLSDEVLETVRLLSDFEAPDKKLLQIILAGQPGLLERLSRPALAQLRQRIAISTRLEPLPDSEVAHYIHHRLQIAGYQGLELFSAEAVELIAKRSQGIPRLINNICFNALSLGCAMRMSQISAEVVREASDELSIGLPSPKPGVPRQPAVRTATAGLRSSLESGYKRIGSNLFGRRLLLTAVVLLALGGLGVVLGTRTRSAPIRPAAVSDLKITNPARVEDPVSPGERLSAVSAAGQAPAAPMETTQTNAGKNPIQSFSYVVQPKDTLRDLCTSMLGRYDSNVLSQIRQLNPTLKNPDVLEVGKEIRLPMSTTK
ncbi:MAG TPA: AAA family ATPase [Candidatus Acidoferrum sp.]|nr:AAA family ATPase [Candidatus Acidoferrum sp.]